MSASRDFWLACGHHLLDRDEGGRLLVTDDFLKAYLARPELMPPPEACVAEQELHRALLRDPRRPVSAAQVDAIVDADARENWQTMVAWRDHLVKHGSLEAAYLAIVRRNIAFPQLFIGQLVQLILRNALDNCGDAFMLRAAELLFRPQKLMIEGASVLAVDEERGSPTGRHSASPLMALLGLPEATEVDVLSESTAGSYWERSDRFDMALDLATGGRGLAALGDVIARWLAHLLAIEVDVEPVAELREASWNWYVGLSSDATRIGDAIWHGDDLDDGSRAQLTGLFRLTFRDPACMIEKVRGEPVYLLLAMTADEVLRLKPQNFITGLPIANAEAVN
ncbi:DUF6352 family protein [Bradyrhizobium sp. Ai1a-2]|uniref:DUF6352 family protein n=1 Tax=Bradyrhizobium sp. Ai1a-2 TaxID=196490 RepID=UPI0003FA1A26|nr:DUF6352 family protein [Bradyrhizobium sp. Ai1a-2]